jgi:hypothetical protein
LIKKIIGKLARLCIAHRRRFYCLLAAPPAAETQKR